MRGDITKVAEDIMSTVPSVWEVLNYELYIKGIRKLRDGRDTVLVRRSYDKTHSKINIAFVDERDIERVLPTPVLDI